MSQIVPFQSPDRSDPPPAGTASGERGFLAARLAEERDRERLRIASDLHDTVLQDLVAIQRQIDNLVLAAGAGPSGPGPGLGPVRGAVEAAISHLRASLAGLRPSPIAEHGLVRALEDHAAAFAGRTGIAVTVAAPSVGHLELPDPLAQLLFECCQEALANVARHSRAGRATVRLELSGPALELCVADDGTGVSSSPASGGSWGLELTRQKVAAWDGDCWLAQSPGRGSELWVRIPLGDHGRRAG